ncbi:MBL fold metallo-hydrolase [Thalassotalea sp. M1531]|uniref:MBL fold metallo-hydrolase n=1 Tax=Thalassotalea algicola TaxID=2716224 RepID=A0A7Y0LAX1_9GAMM|nr:MBL fold metallo-hydrolase [Thalassotalea algicola]NMP31183.1 MBL fold metallo-hydrolase [Thalassotalea algicola]
MSAEHIKQLSPDTQLIELSGYIQSIYLVRQGERLLLLDGCCRADVKLISHYIQADLKLPLSALKLVVVTHMHPDHAGAAHKLRKLTGCKVASANVTGHWYSGIDGKLMHLTDIALANWVGQRKGKKKTNLWYNPKLSPDIKLNDGELLPNFEDWQVLFTQGHTDRDISLLHTPSHKVYVADLMVTVRGRYIPPFPLFYPNRYQESLSRIKELAPNSVILAHGGEVHPDESDYQHIFDLAPKIPLTHWRSVKIKLKKVIFGR